MSKTVFLDLRGEKPREKTQRVFRLFDELTPGDSLELTNDEGNQRLYYRFLALHPRQFKWVDQGRSDQAWKACIVKVSEEAGVLGPPES